MTKNAASLAYERRFSAVLAHIEAHTGEALSLDELAAVAAYSAFHFHRQFSALTGSNVHRYVLCSRLKLASTLLAFRADSIGDIAALCGYETPEAFARAFRQFVGVSPTEFRAAPDWVDWNRRFEPYFNARTRLMSRTESRDVSLVDFPETRVALLEHRGDPRRLNETIARFIVWRKRTGLHPRMSATFNVFFDEDGERIGLCAATSQPIAPNEEGVVPMTIPGGECAKLRHIGSDDALEASVRYLYSTWLPASGREPRDFPPFVQRVVFYPDVPEAEAVTDIFLPLKD